VNLRAIGAMGLAVALVVLVTPLWLPLLGSGLAVDDSLQPADAALVLEGTGKDAIQVVEVWRQQGTVRNVVIVEAPVKTHALVAYWSDLVGWGLAPAATTPAEHLRIARSPSTQAGQQAQAALGVLQEFGARSLDVAGGGGIGSRLVERELQSVFGPAGITLRLVRYGEAGRDPARWWQNADDRRAVLDSWLQLLVPFLSGYDPSTGS
jgi:hypothetical protein